MGGVLFAQKCFQRHGDFSTVVLQPQLKDSLYVRYQTFFLHLSVGPLPADHTKTCTDDNETMRSLVRSQIEKIEGVDVCVAVTMESRRWEQRSSFAPTY